MENLNQFLEQLHQNIKNNPTSAEQGLNLTTPQPAQIHWPQNQEDPDLFYLITEVFDNYCEVIPGSFDSMMACDDDIILPKSVFGNFVFLSLNLAATLPVSAIGKGFARLNDETYNRVIDSQIEYETGEKGEYASFPFATLPYANPQDPRKIYHDNIASIIIDEQQKFIEKMADIPEDNIIRVNFSQSMSIPDKCKIDLPPIFEKEEFCLAAGEEKRNPYAECYVFNYDTAIFVEYEIDKKLLRIDCFLSSDSSEESLLFDGWYVCDSCGKKIGIIDEGKARIEDICQFDGQLSFLDEFGYFHAVYPKGND